MKHLVDNEIARQIVGKPSRHPKCRGHTVHNMDGSEYECDYATTLDCDQCKYGGGSKNPEAKRHQIK